MPGQDRGYQVARVFSEANGVGGPPTEALEALLPGRVERVNTTQATKELAFARILDLLTAKRLVLPDDPQLVQELAGLEATSTVNGGVRIAAAGVGHDDLAMALSFCALALEQDVADADLRNAQETLERIRGTHPGREVPGRDSPVPGRGAGGRD